MRFVGVRAEAEAGGEAGSSAFTAFEVRFLVDDAATILAAEEVVMRRERTGRMLEA